MKEDRQKRIVKNILDYQSRKKVSQNALATELGISGPHMSNIMTGMNDPEKWAKVGEELWNKLAFRFDSNDWQVYQTANFQAIQLLCHDMQRDSETACIAEYTGAGKSVGLKAYANNTPNAYYVQCNQLLTKKDLLREIQQALGIYSEGRIVEMLQDIIKALEKKQRPILLIDEADKLSDACLLIIKVIYDALEFKCGFVMAGTEVLWQRIDKNSNRNKLGFKELKRRFFTNRKPLRKFETGQKWLVEELAVICEDQGVTDPDFVQHILDTATNYGDVRTQIRTYQRIKKKTT